MDDLDSKMTLREKLTMTFKLVKLIFQLSPGSVVLLTIDSIINGVMPFATSYIVAMATNQLALAAAGNAGATRALLGWIVAGGLTVIMSALWYIYFGYASWSVRFKINVGLSQKLFNHYINLDFKCYDDKNMVDGYERANMFVNTTTVIFRDIMQIISAIIGLVSAVVLLWSVNLYLAIVGILLMAPSMYYELAKSRKNVAIRRGQIDKRRYANDIARKLRDPDSISEIRLYGLGDYLINQWLQFRTTEQVAIMNNERKFLPFRVGYTCLRYGFQIGSMIWTAIEIAARRQPIGNFVLVQNAIGGLMRQFSAMSGIISTMSELAGMSDYERFAEMPAATLGAKRLKQPTQTIEVEHVNFTYPNSQRQVLTDVSFKLQAGQHIAIVGENGAGKTTLTKLLCGMYQPSSGQILINGDNLSSLNVNDWQSQLAMLTQDFVHYTFATAKDNVLFGDIHKKAHQDELYQQALVNSEAQDFVKKLPYGDDTYMDTWTRGKKAAGTRISGGQWQRLALARSFYRNAPIVILDEPTSAIDAAAEARIFDHLFSDNDKTIIVISHRLSTIKKADRIYMLADGQIVEQGSYRQLIAKQGRFYNMFKSQM